MAKTGRARRDGERYPSGKLKPVEQQNLLAPTEVRRIIDMAKRKATDPILGTVLGWLRLHGELTDRQVSAATRYATLRGVHARVMGFPPRSAASPSYQVGYGEAGGPEDEAKIVRIVREYRRMCFLLSKANQQLLDRICIDDETLCGFERRRFVNALDTLAMHFGS